MNNYKELKVWQKSIEVAVIFHNITIGFPKYEIFGLTSQIRRSANSIAANIAEGSARSSKKVFFHFLSIALGSAFELDTHLQIANRIGYLSEVNFNELSILIIDIEKMVRGLQKSINN